MSHHENRCVAVCLLSTRRNFEKTGDSIFLDLSNAILRRASHDVLEIAENLAPNFLGRPLKASHLSAHQRLLVQLDLARSG